MVHMKQNLYFITSNKKKIDKCPQLFPILTDFNLKNSVHTQSIEINGRFLLCDHRPFCNQTHFIYLILRRQVSLLIEPV